MFFQWHWHRLKHKQLRTGFEVGSPTPFCTMITVTLSALLQPGCEQKCIALSAFFLMGYLKRQVMNLTLSFLDGGRLLLIMGMLVIIVVGS